MTTFVGFSTIDQNKKFTLVDIDLIKRDLLNAFNIRQGELVGRPGYGTVIWDYVFENQTQETLRSLTTEIERIVGGDPRIQVADLQIFPQQNGILIQLELTVIPGQTATLLSVFFNEQTRRASYV
jgi:phage baseplate assembly protein W